MLNLRSSARPVPSRVFFCLVIFCLLLSVGQRASAVGELGGSIGGFVGPYALGAVKDRTQGFGPALLALAAMAIGASVLVMLLKRARLLRE